MFRADLVYPTLSGLPLPKFHEVEILSRATSLTSDKANLSESKFVALSYNN